MSFFSQTPQNKAPVGVLDITGGSIGASLLVYSEGQGTLLPRHSVSVRYDFPLDMPQAEAPHIPREALTNALNKLKLGSPDLKHLRVFFAPPHGASHLYICERAFDKDTLIVKELIHELMDEAFASFKKDEPDSVSFPLLFTVEWVHVNGYSVDTPVGTQARSISLAMSVSAARGLAEALAPAVSKLFSSRTEFEYYASGAALSRGILHAYPAGPKNFLTVAIGDTNSTISTIWHGLLIAENTIALGKRSVMERIARALNVPPLPALLFLRDPSTAPPQLAAMLPAVTAPIVNEWSREFNAAAQAILKSRFVPETVYLVSDEPALLALGVDSLNDPTLMGFTFSDALRTITMQDPTRESVQTLREGGAYEDSRLMLFAHFCASIDEVRHGEPFLASNTHL